MTTIKPPISELRGSSTKLQDLFKKLSTGKRINQASDDPAGLAVANSLKFQEAVSKQGQRNSELAKSALNIADGSMGVLSDISTRMAELATQGANSLLSSSQRQALDTEFQQLKQESERVKETTQFNSVPLLNGAKLDIQVGQTSDSLASILVPSSTLTSQPNVLDGLSLTSTDKSLTAIEGIKRYSVFNNSSRTEVGASTNRLEVAANNLANIEESLAAARSQIEDFDYAKGVADRTALDIRQKVSSALSGQAGKINSQSISALLN